jgi:hypothetical protein
MLVYGVVPASGELLRVNYPLSLMILKLSLLYPRVACAILILPGFPGVK